jgi:hypothetical protein
MVEQYIVVDRKTINYEGLLDVQEFYRALEEWLKQQAYDKKEKITSESITKDGRHIELELEPWHGFTDYARSMMDIRLVFDGVKDVDVVIDGVKQRMQKGRVLVMIDAFLETDYEGRWEEKPAMLVIRSIFDKFFLRSETNKHKQFIAEDVNRLGIFITTFLNMYRYKK